jgi:uncharacterized protein (DUF1697 family)
MHTTISLLRGINVGGNKKIKMAELKTAYEALGFRDVVTLLQSGNVVFKTDETDLDALAERIEAGLKQQCALKTRILLRSPDHLRAIVADHPFTDAQLQDPGKILVTFMTREPDADAVAALIDGHSGPETIHHRGQELYITYPEGMGRSKLTNTVIERTLTVISTGRNWNTVNKLLARV